MGGPSERFAMESAVSVACGEARHDVIFRVDAAGDVQVAFNPCQVLPGVARQLSRSSCRAQVAAIQQASQFMLQAVWDDEANFLNVLSEASRVVPRQFSEFALHVRLQRAELAAAVMGSPTEAQLQEALETADPSRCWAALTLLQGKYQAWDESFANELLRKATSWAPNPRIGLLHVTGLGSVKCRSDLLAVCIADESIAPSFRRRFVAELAGIGDPRYGMQFCDLLVTRPDSIGTGELVNGLRTTLKLAVTRSTGADLLATQELVRRCLEAAGNSRELATMLHDNADLIFIHLASAAQNAENLTTTRLAAVTAIAGTVGPQTWHLLLDLCRETSQDPAVANAAASTLIALREAITQDREHIVPFLDVVMQYGRRRDLGQFAIDLLLQLDCPETLDILVRGLYSTKLHSLVVATLRAIGRLGQREGILPLLQFRATTRNEELCNAVGVSLAAILDGYEPTELDTRQLGQILSCNHLAATSSSVFHLAAQGTPEARAMLTRSLSIPLSGDCLLQVLAGLQEVGDTAALLPVLNLLQVQTGEVAVRATQVATSLLQAAATASDGQSPLDVRIVRTALSCRYFAVAREACQLIRASGDPRFYADLYKACARGDAELARIAGAVIRDHVTIKEIEGLLEIALHGDVVVNNGIQAALVAIGQKAVPSLAKVARRKFVPLQLCALRGLSQIGGPQAEQALRQAAADPNDRVRDLAQSLQAGSKTDH